jgi:hypothetical protein
MYINAKMIPVETIPGMGEWVIKERGDDSLDIFDPLSQRCTISTN